MAENSPYTRGQFPSPLLPRKEMDKPETGRAVGNAIYQTSVLGENSYYWLRNQNFAENRTFSAGKQPFQTYLDLLGTDGKTSYANYAWHPRPIAPKFRDILINDIMSRIENVDCTGLSLEIQKRKDMRKTEMAFQMEHGDYLNQIQQSAGVQLAQKQDFIPENEEELELWDNLKPKEKEEQLMEWGIDFILYNNDWNSIKKEVTGDLVDVGLGATQTYFDGRKRIRVKRIRPEYMVYGATNTLNFRNVAYMAHLERMSITDVRSMFPDTPEQDLYKAAYQNRGLYANPDQLIDFIQDFEIAYTRPYDSWLIDVMFYEYKVMKTINYVKGKDNNDNPIFDLNRKTDGTNPNKKTYVFQIPTIYKGAWMIGSDTMLSWGEMENLIRSREDVEDVKFSYSVYMLNNNGDMLPTSPMEMMRSSIVQMDLAILRMQNVIASTPPNGMKMDLDAITELELGKGIGKVGPLKLRELWMQTGDVYYSSSKISGDNANRSPIEQNLNELGDKLHQYIEVYNFELNCIRDYLGINEVKDGSQVNPRIGLGVMQGQQAASNLATAHIYGGWVSLMTDTCEAASILFWDALNTPETNDMYIRLLGKQNADFLLYNKELTKSNYLTKISVNMTLQDRTWLNQQIEVALAQGKLMLEDALMVNKYASFNIEYAIRYLSFMEKKRQQMAQRQQMQLAQQQQQATAAQADQLMQQKQQDEEQKDKREAAKLEKQALNDHKLLIQQLINAALLEEQKTGQQLPTYVQLAINEQLKGKVLEQEAQIESMTDALEIHDLQMTQNIIQQQAMQAQQQALPPGQDSDLSPDQSNPNQIAQGQAA